MKTTRYIEPKLIIKNDISLAFRPSLKQKFILRFMIWCAMGALLGFAIWFFQTTHIGFLGLYIPLTAGLIFKLVRMAHEWYHYYDLSAPEPPKKFPALSVDMFTTYCPGEPYEMIVNTLKAMVAVKYPHSTYLCDEGNDSYLKNMCDALGVIHVTRTNKKDAKAGNINNALQISSGDLCIVLDPDHVPIPDFIDRVLPYFVDEKVGYVQCVQGYYNQKESLIALGAAEQTYHFYGPMMMCMNSYGTVQAIGANCTFRRKALESIGGHAAGLAEDMHTAMRIHSEGWKTLYIPEVLTKGLVPSSLSAYYKQQLKWSRGTFDLLFHVYPKLFKKFTWRQRLHYLTLPMYFFVGFFSLIDILVPIIALFTSHIPWKVNFEHFAIIFTSLFGLSLLIRQYAQNWLMEKHERGFHLVGGLLRHGTWWVYILGFMYTVFNVKVPYIPTPKEGEPENAWRLVLPNMVLFCLSLLAIFYGLSVDWSPYSFFMATFAGINSILLGISILIGQEKLLLHIGKTISSVFNWQRLISPFRDAWWFGRQLVYYSVRKSAFTFSCFFSVLFIAGFFEIKQSTSLDNLNKEKDTKEYGAFYFGRQLPQANSLQWGILDTTKSFDVFTLDLEWAEIDTKHFPKEKISAIFKKKGVPVINWLPKTSNFNCFSEDASLSNNLGAMKAIKAGKLDFYLDYIANEIRTLKYPVMINFAPDGDNPAKSWSVTGGNSAQDYKEAWQYVVEYFIEKGVYNASWIWNPWKPSGIISHNPGEHYFDWIGVPVLNESSSEADAFLYSFEALYEPFHREINKHIGLEKKPVMIAKFGILSNNESQNTWINNSFSSIKQFYPEIKSLILFEGEIKAKKIDENGFFYEYQTLTNQYNFHASSHQVFKSALAEAPFNQRLFFTYKILQEQKNKKTKKRSIVGSPGNFKLIVEKKPYYIKGIAYNPGHDWRDGNWPLTRRQLIEDFEKVKASGANTIRRYSPGFYDENILNVAQEFDLKVLYGFWFDPEKDYLRDKEIISNYRDKLVEKVEEFKGKKSVLGWSIGNETWGLLKHHYAQPYLTLVRLEYMEMVNEFSQILTSIDPERPLITACEHSWQLSNELFAWKDNAPLLDIIAINSYYEEQIGKLSNLTWTADSSRPYIVSEFGPKGYWNPEYSSFVNDSLLWEERDYQKADIYAHEWKNYVAGKKGQNLGGFAYCWRDRMEGSNTWFGITDFNGRLKPVYYALKNQWKGESDPRQYMNVEIYPEPLTNNKLRFKVYLNNMKSEECSIQWSLNREEYLEKVGNISYFDKDRAVEIELPDAYSKYRLYVHVSDNNGSVATASIPLRK